MEEFFETLCIPNPPLADLPPADPDGVEIIQTMMEELGGIDGEP